MSKVEEFISKLKGGEIFSVKVDSEELRVRILSIGEGKITGHSNDGFIYAFSIEEFILMSTATDVYFDTTDVSYIWGPLPTDSFIVYLNPLKNRYLKILHENAKAELLINNLAKSTVSLL